ncbi:hypothetical protein BJ742DRAFT_807172 [Cladochytrium replicatum]|nr:hypothetical protein BJ742DRAFT_807172 [Cladochytrium replicatum]
MTPHLCGRSHSPVKHCRISICTWNKCRPGSATKPMALPDSPNYEAEGNRPQRPIVIAGAAGGAANEARAQWEAELREHLAIVTHNSRLCTQYHAEMQDYHAQQADNISAESVQQFVTDLTELFELKLNSLPDKLVIKDLLNRLVAKITMQTIELRTLVPFLGKMITSAYAKWEPALIQDPIDAANPNAPRPFHHKPTHYFETVSNILTDLNQLVQLNVTMEAH